MSGADLLRSGPVAVTAGVDVLAAELEAQEVEVARVEWRPADRCAAELGRLAPEALRIADANRVAIARMNAARPGLVGISTAADAFGLERGCFLHAGPPIEWERMCGPLRGAIVGGAMLEGLADSREEAEREAASGSYDFAPCHEHGAVGPMAGVMTPSMPVWVVEDAAGGKRAHCTLNEGLGKVLRYGAFAEPVLERLRWLERELAPLLAGWLAAREAPLDLRAITAQALEMGDEAHNRNRAATSLLLRELAPALLDGEGPRDEAARALRFVDSNDHFFLNLAMPMAKLIADAAEGVEGSSVVTTMSRNGTDFGLRVAGAGARWFTGPAQRVEGLYFPGFGPEDANPDIGDSAITETVGLGGFAMAAAPAIVGFVGGTSDLALRTTRAMYEITCGESDSFRIPALDFRGSPLGIDCREVVRAGVLPRINTGIAHREAGVGQVGAGLVTPPIEAFTAAVGSLAERLPAEART